MTQMWQFNHRPQAGYIGFWHGPVSASNHVFTRTANHPPISWVIGSVVGRELAWKPLPVRASNLMITTAYGLSSTLPMDCITVEPTLCGQRLSRLNFNLNEHELTVKASHRILTG